MHSIDRHYIDGRFVPSHGTERFLLTNPADESEAGSVTMGDPQDVDAAVRAARQAFLSFSKSKVADRIALLEAIQACLATREADLADAIVAELGAPAELARTGHARLPQFHVRTAIDLLRDFSFDHVMGTTLVKHVPVGVCGLITPWNWPASVTMSKIVPALAVGCTMVLKPSEFTPRSAQILAEILDAAGVPAGVFNLVHGNGPGVGHALSAHPDIDLVSITGSNRAGAEVAKAAADTIKIVHQELGGKSPNLILPDADLRTAVENGIRSLMANSGQTCSAPSRMLVPQLVLDEVKTIAHETASAITVGPPASGSAIGPVINRAQFERIQSFIESGIADGATVVAGGTGRPDGLDQGYYIKPTIFADTTPDMAIVRQEIFGPVLVIQSYETVEEAIALANDTVFGLAAYVQGADRKQVADVAAQLDAGQVYLNSSGMDGIDLGAPFGGLKQSGNGREWGSYGFEAFMQTKAFVGHS